MTETSLALRPKPVELPKIKPSGRELELKFLVAEPEFKASQRWALLGEGPKRAPAQKLRSVYYDTANGDLRRQNIFLRMRSLRRGHVMTCKWSGLAQGGLFERGEIEVAATAAEPQPELLGAELAGAIAQASGGQALLAVFETDIRRIIRRVHSGGALIEVAFDAGFIIAGEQRLAVREIELELKGGDAAELYRLGISLAQAYPVRLGVLSKSERGARLSLNETPMALRAAPGLSGAPTVDEAIGQLVNACIGQFMGNWPAFESGDKVNAVHQMRVAMRRLRSLLWIFNRAFPCPEFTELRAQAKFMASGMEEARNWDVFIAMLAEGPRRFFGAGEGFDEILAQCEARRAAGYAAVEALLADAGTTRFILTLQAFISRHGWRNGLSGEALPRLTEPARSFANANLQRLHERLLRRGKKLAEGSAHERHEIRIELKKLRYATELFGGLYENTAPLRACTKAMSRLQDRLGLFNDMVTAQQMAARLDASSPAANRAVGIILGWTAAARPDEAGLAKRWKDFRRAKFFARG